MDSKTKEVEIVEQATWTMRIKEDAQSGSKGSAMWQNFRCFDTKGRGALKSTFVDVGLSKLCREVLTDNEDAIAKKIDRLELLCQGDGKPAKQSKTKPKSKHSHGYASFTLKTTKEWPECFEAAAVKKGFVRVAEEGTFLTDSVLCLQLPVFSF